MTGCLLCSGSAGSKLRSDLSKPSWPCTLSAGGQCLACEKVAKIDVKIRQVRKQLVALLKQRQEVLPEVNVAHNPVVLRVPPELSAMIFESCVPTPPLKLEPEACEKTTRAEIKAPLVLGSVCRGWRELAWSMPRLWTHLDVRIDQAYDCAEEISVLSEWLGRSGALPLSIHIHSELDKDFRFSQSLKGFISAINQNYHRWETLYVYAPPSILNLLVGGARSRMEPRPILLRSLRLFPRGIYSSRERETLRFVMKHVVPAPTEVALRDMGFNSVSIDWRQVTRVRLDGIQLDDCLEVLKQAKFLEYCKLTCDGGVLSSLSSEPLVITLPSLRDVVFMDDACELCEILVLPALVSLHIKRAYSLRVDLLIAMFRRSACQLQSLSIEQSVGEPAVLNSLLREIPSLKHFSYQTRSRYSGGLNVFELLANLACRPTGSTSTQTNSARATFGLLPKLVSLEVDIEQPLPSNLKEMPQFLGLLFGEGNTYRQSMHRVHLNLLMRAHDRYELPRDVALSFLACVSPGTDFKFLCKNKYTGACLDLLEQARKDGNITDVEIQQHRLDLVPGTTT